MTATNQTQKLIVIPLTLTALLGTSTVFNTKTAAASTYYGYGTSTYSTPTTVASAWENYYNKPSTSTYNYNNYGTASTYSNYNSYGTSTYSTPTTVASTWENYYNKPSTSTYNYNSYSTPSTYSTPTT
ncbi:hypothetical protein ABEY71_28555, partial [Bacillus toyonensis]